jgi:hypothetical protein
MHTQLPPQDGDSPERSCLKFCLLCYILYIKYLHTHFDIISSEYKYLPMDFSNHMTETFEMFTKIV